MISSYFASAEETGLQGQTASFLFDNPDILAFSDLYYDDRGAGKFADAIFANLDHKGRDGSDRRELGLGMLSKALETETRLAGEVLCDGRLKQLIDRLPTLFDAVEGEGEARSLVRCLELLLLRDAAISSSLSKVLPKLIARTCTFLKRLISSSEIDECSIVQHL